MNIKRLTRNPATIAGIILVCSGLVILFFYPLLAAAIFFSYILLCVAASFFPQTNFLFPAISRGQTGENLVALTFDDGPAEPTTKDVLEILDKYSVKATFFVTGINALKHPEIIWEILSRGHSIGNHSFSHNPFLMLTSYNNIYREISSAEEVLLKIGAETLAFRPPVGIVNPKLSPILDKLGMYCVLFSCRAYDAGNLHVKGLSSKILKKVKADDIIMLNDVPTRKKEDSTLLLPEIELVIQGIIAKGLRIVPLAVLIRKEIISSRGVSP